MATAIFGTIKSRWWIESQQGPDMWRFWTSGRNGALGVAGALGRVTPIADMWRGPDSARFGLFARARPR